MPLTAKEEEKLKQRLASRPLPEVEDVQKSRVIIMDAMDGVIEKIRELTGRAKGDVRDV